MLRVVCSSEQLNGVNNTYLMIQIARWPLPTAFQSSGPGSWSAIILKLCTFPFFLSYLFAFKLWNLVDIELDESFSIARLVLKVFGLRPEIPQCIAWLPKL